MDASAAIPGLEADAAAALSREARQVRLGTGGRVFAPGQACSVFLVVTAGSVRVSTAMESGRELVLYRVGPGETCVLTTACLMSSSDYDAEGIAETDVEALAIPKPVFEKFLADSPAFRRFVFSSYGGRLRDLIGLVHEVSQRHVDRRLARFLGERGTERLAMTHREIAAELGTAREVVSRLLKQFEAEGLVRLDRRQIMVADPGGLQRLAGQM
jgi:CRP/FNR family transcriptional regulator